MGSQTRLEDVFGMAVFHYVDIEVSSMYWLIAFIAEDGYHCFFRE